MKQSIQTPTIREQLAVKVYVLSGERLSPRDVYRLATRASLEEVNNLKDLPATASRWFHSQKILDLLAIERTAMQVRKEAERKQIETEILTRIHPCENATTSVGMVDYSLPVNQVRKLNELVNTAEDASEALDALKVLLSKQSELAPTRRDEKQVRAYLPISCYECPLYIEKQSRI